MNFLAAKAEAKALLDEAAFVGEIDSRKQLWHASGLIGVMKDDVEHLSVTYKHQVADYLDKKYSAHVSKK